MPFIVSSTRRTIDMKMSLSARPRAEKLNIVSTDHGRTQKYNFLSCLDKFGPKNHNC